MATPTETSQMNGETFDPTAPETQTQPSLGDGDQSQTGSPQGSQGGDQGTQEDRGSQSAFNHPDLRSRTPEEIEQYFELMQRTIREQGQALNQFSQSAPRPAQPEPSQNLTNDNYWQDPVTTLQTMIDRSLEPFRRDMQTVRAGTVLDGLRAELPDFDRYYPMVDATLTQQGVTDRSNPNILRLAYLAIRGQEVVQGKASGGQPGGSGPSMAPPPPAAPPQHRPSNTPLPAQNGGQKTLRELTESERTIARTMGYTPEQYLQWLEVDEGSVSDSKIGREGGSQ